jgi:steroid delta-isomerase-like uncharacterized protein
MTPTEEKNKALVLTHVNEIVNKGRGELIKELYAEDVHYFDPFTEGKEGHGLEAITNFIVGTKKAFPDFNFTIDNIFTNGNNVVWYGSATGSYQVQFPGLPPANGKSFKIPMCQIFEIIDGKVKKMWVFTDSLGLAFQIGALG